MKATKSHSLSPLSLQDTRIRLDQSGKSSAYVVTRGSSALDASTIDELIEASAALGNVNLRICLHPELGNSLHSMIVLARQGTEFRPHKHRTKDETYQAIRGEGLLHLLDDDGKVIESTLLGTNGSIVIRVERGRFHLLVPHSPILVYHESRPGPFEDGDSEFLDLP